VEEARRQNDDVTWHSLIASVAAHARQGRRGINRMREVITAGLANTEVTETDGELAALGLLREHGFGEPMLQHQIFADDGRYVAKMDLAFVDDRVDLEVDGSIHLRPDVRLKDQARDHELRSVYGWTVERIPSEIPVRDPRLFVSIVRQTFRDAQARRLAEFR
jgi:very-short-patch-repair endonuclease